MFESLEGYLIDYHEKETQIQLYAEKLISRYIFISLLLLYLLMLRLVKFSYNCICLILILT